MNLIGTEGTKQLLSDGLFKSDKIKSISFFMHEASFTNRDKEDKFMWKGVVNFVNESLSGAKEFKVNGKDGLEQLLREMDNFIKSL